MLIDILKEIEDPRSYHGKEYQLWQILLVSILSILAEGKTYTDIRTFLDVLLMKNSTKYLNSTGDNFLINLLSEKSL